MERPIKREMNSLDNFGQINLKIAELNKARLAIARTYKTALLNEKPDSPMLNETKLRTGRSEKRPSM